MNNVICVCPHCGHEGMTQAHTMSVMIEVTDWEERDGKLVPIAEGLHRDCPDSLMEDPDTEFCCKECGHLFDEPLVLEGPDQLPRRPAWAHEVTDEEGWYLRERKNGRCTIERTSKVDAFATTAGAIRFVRARAGTGSLVHAWAIAHHDYWDAKP